MKVVAVFSVKGGVGKTTAAVNLAAQAAQGDARVLVWDLDPQGAATFLLGAKPRVKGGTDALVTGEAKARAAVVSTSLEGVDLIPADSSNRELELALAQAKKSGKRLSLTLEPLTKKYDVVVLDSPPGASLLARNVLQAADAVVVPLVPSPLAMRSLDQVRAILAEAKSPPSLVGFLSMVDRRKAAHREAAATLHTVHDDVADVVVPASVVVERMGTNLAPVAAYAPRSEAAGAYARLWDVVRAVLDPRVGTKYRKIANVNKPGKPRRP